jgi:N-methylhydantoinase A
VRVRGRSFEAAVYQREALRTDQRIEGPAIVEQMDTTTFIPPDWHATPVASGALILTRAGAESC